MRRALVVVTTLLAVSACSFSVGTKTVDKDKVAEQVSQQLGQQIGREPDSVECPDDLEGKEGATLRCTLTDGGQTYGVDVVVTSVEGKDVKFSIKVDDTPQ